MSKSTAHNLTERVAEILRKVLQCNSCCTPECKTLQPSDSCYSVRQLAIQLQLLVDTLNVQDCNLH